MHAAAVAHDLNMAGVIIPPSPGVFSAFGLLVADVQHDYVRSRLVELDQDALRELRPTLGDLAALATGELADEGFDTGAMEIDYALDMRYRGQGYELTVPISIESLERGDLESIRKAFDELHLERFSHSAPDERVEVASCRVTGRGRACASAVRPSSTRRTPRS